MGLKIKSVLAWAIAVCTLAVTALYGAIVYTTLDDEPVFLLSCYGVEKTVLAWTCEQVLLHASLSPEQVRELNTQAGAQYPMQMDDPKKAEEMLKLFLARGVDINAQITKEARLTKTDVRWTALHIAAAGAAPEQVALLLKYGARTDIRDGRGKTPLEWAQEVQQRHPSPSQSEIVRILEEAERKAIERK